VIELDLVNRLRLAAVVSVLGIIALATPVAAQFPLFQQPGLPGTLVDPQELQQPRRAPFTLTPSITITGEFNDNIFIDNRNKVSDFIIGFTPGLALSIESPTYRLAAGYNFTSEVFTQETDESHAFDRQNFFLDSLWRVDPFLTLSLTDSFVFSTDTNLVSTASVATGRNRGFSNVLAAGAAWQFAPLWLLRGDASWTTERFDSSDLVDSDVYRIGPTLERRFSRQLIGDIGYEFGYFDIEREEKTTTHTPRVGVTWQPTATISLTLRGGPSFEIKDSGDSRVTPAVSASYRQRLPFGAIGLAYDREIGTAGGLGGTTDNQLISGFVDVTTLTRGLLVQLLPRYSIVESPNSNRIDVQSFTAALQVTYRVTAWMALLGGYQFFHQRSDSTLQSSIGTAIANDADQNRVFFGIQFGYPIRFD
jgi:hypothetical protein